MNLKAFLLVLLLGACALGFNACISSRQKQAAQAQKTQAVETTGTSAGSNTTLPSSAATNSGANILSVKTDPEHAKYVRETIARLETLESNNDQDSLNAILAEMKNPDKQIRTAALSATVQFNDRSAIPRLQEIAAQTEDPSEKAQILKAIDYMKLPSISEYLAQRRASSAARTNAPAAPAAGTNIPQPGPGQP
jgi:HEAT repeats